jgi:hypothetical protein
LHLWHRTTLSPFFKVPLPSQFLHFSFFAPAALGIASSDLQQVRSRYLASLQAAIRNAPAGANPRETSLHETIATFRSSFIHDRFSATMPYMFTIPEAYSGGE